MKPLQSAKILLVDDEEMLREILVSELCWAGALVTEAASGQAAWKALQVESFDIIISDIRMKDGDGLFLLGQVQTLDPNRRPLFYICTGYDDLTAGRVPEGQVRGKFSKPFDLECIVQKISTDWKRSSAA